MYDAGMPSMSDFEIELFKEKLIQQAAHGKPLRVFEYGTGYSTVYFSKFLNSKGIDHVWHSMDNDKEWHEKIKAEATPNMMLLLSEFHPAIKDGNQRPPVHPEELTYINGALSTGLRYDLIFVDGRFRRRCLGVAKECLADKGIIILHDAHRLHYHPGLKGIKGDIIDSRYAHYKIFVGQA